MVKAAAKSESTILRSPVPLIFNVLTAVATSEPIVFDPLTPEPVAVISTVSAVDKVKTPTCPLALMLIFCVSAASASVNVTAISDAVVPV